ncbi:MAG TPA: protein kinase [Candidatus Angelobacter sp.]|nr:protein kinase [Candidatus Angelobacter sp.]
MTGGTKLGRYEIVAPLGSGGMGEVYRAHDGRLNRDVAIKVLPPGRHGDETARQRFMREARAASALNHPNIITIYETDEQDGMAFIAMEYVRGRTLAQIMGKERLSDAEAINYAAQIAEALVKAHAAGIIHRDLKPGNVMITGDGLVKVLDFGLAKFQTAASAATAAGEHDSDATISAALSMPGSTLGTLSYMSPEQARGGPVDSRSDIFSFGIMLFEMLTGQLPFEGENLLAVLHSLHFGAVKDIHYLRPDLPPAVADIVGHCLQKKPEDRYQNTEELARDLRALKQQSVAAIGSAVAVQPVPPAAAESRRAETAAKTVRPGRRWKISAAVVFIALLASVFAVPSWRQRIFSSNAASKQGSSGAAEAAPDNPFALQQQAQKYLERWDVPTNLDRSITLLNRAIELDHDYAPAYASLTFAYFEKNRLNPDPQWARQATQSAVRAVQLNNDLADSHLAAGISAMLNGKKDVAEREFRKAADLDPKNSKPHRWLGFLYTSTGDKSEAEAELGRALILNPEDWRTNMDMGLLYYKTDRYAEAAKAWEKVSNLTPDNFIVLKNLGAAYHMMDRHDDAASAMQRSLEIKPAATTYNNLGTLRFFQGRYDDAVAAFEKAVDMSANNYYFWGNLGDAYRWAPGQRGKSNAAYNNAIRLAHESLASHPQDNDVRANLALYLAKTGDKKDALDEIGKVDGAAKKEGGDYFRSALVHELCGERDRALHELSSALNAGYALREIKNEPELIALRADQRYQSLVTKQASK